MYDIDLFDASPAVFADLIGKNKVVICYVDCGTWENWRADAAKFPESVKGKNVEGWAGEKWLDIRQIDILGPIIRARFDMAVAKKCTGIEPDNIDGYSNPSGFPLTAADQIKFNTFLATEAHARNLSIGLKNDNDQVNQLVTHFDWAINEECFNYNECDPYRAFIQANLAVFQVEYALATNRFCPQANTMKLSSMRKHLQLDDWAQTCW